MRKEPNLYAHKITNNQEISPGVHLISVERNFDFLPGQVVKIGIDRKHPPRIYSICSSINDQELRILFNIKEDGFLTPKMAGMIPGETLLISEPYGSFIGTDEPAWFIATGTGIAPFISMLFSGNHRNKTLLHGVSYLNQFYFEDELEELLQERYIRACSRESSCNTFPGRVTDYLNMQQNLPEGKYYICGKAIAVVETRDYLIAQGIPFNDILAEIYF